MISSAAILCVACLLVIGCGGEGQTASSSDVRMDADTLVQPADSLMIEDAGAARMAPEVAGGGTQTPPSAALSDMASSSTPANAASGKPQRIPQEAPAARRE